MKAFPELSEEAQEASVLALTGSLLKLYLANNPLDLVDIPSAIVKDLDLLRANKFLDNNMPIPPGARERIIKRVSNSIQDHCESACKHTSYSEYYSISFDYSGWIKVLVNTDPKKLINEPNLLPTDTVGR